MTDPSNLRIRRIDAELSVAVTSRASARTAIGRRCRDITRAEADILNYERTVATCDTKIERLLDERDRASRPRALTT